MSSRRSLSQAEGGLLSNYLEALAAQRIEWILLRNYDELPKVMGNDIDLFVPRRSLALAMQILERVLSEAGGRIFLVHDREYFRDIRFGFGDPSTALCLDLYHGPFTWHGLRYLEDADLLAQSEMRGGLRVPRPAHEALGLTFSSLLWGGFYKSRYRTRIRELLAQPGERKEFYERIAAAFGPDASRRFERAAEAEDEKEMVRTVPYLRRGLRKTHFRRAPFEALERMAHYWVWEFATVLSPRGLAVAVLGPDGTGKSAALNEVERNLGGLFGQVHRFHWRPQVLPDIGVLFGLRAASTDPVSQPHAKSKHSAVVSLLRLAYYLADYWIGYWPKILKPKAQVHLVLFDRYAPDMWCDPTRYRFRLSKGLVRFLSRLVPSPDFTFVLLTDAETIVKRKGEMSVDAANELMEEYRRLPKAERRCFAVDAKQTLDKVAAEIERPIVAYLLERENDRNDFSHH